MKDLFGEEVVKGGQAARRSPLAAVPPIQRREAPVVTGGLFALADTISPERFAAVFNSGASAYYDALGFIELNKDVGVVATIISERTTGLLGQYLGRGGKVFCDSGAFGQFQSFLKGAAASPEADFEAVFATYDRLLAATPQQHRANLTVVAPDVLADCQRSLELLQEHKPKVCGYIAAGINVIVPVQRGQGTAHATVTQVKAILGTDAFTVGIPSESAALELSDAATIRDHGRFHILGRGAMGMPLFQRAYAVLEHNPGAHITCDATQILSHTPWISKAQAELVEENAPAVWEEGAFDEAELAEALLSGADWIKDSTIRDLASFYGVKDDISQQAWVREHRHGEEGVRPLVEEVDPELSMLFAYGLRPLFSAPAMKHLSARMRATAIQQVFGDRKAA